jgi:hypothetical protein
MPCPYCILSGPADPVEVYDAVIIPVKPVRRNAHPPFAACSQQKEIRDKLNKAKLHNTNQNIQKPPMNETAWKA